MLPPPPSSTLFPYTTLFRSDERPRPARERANHGRFVLKARDARETAIPPALSIRSLVGGRRSARNPNGTLLNPKQRSEEHTSELQSRRDLVCRLLLEKKKTD